MPLYHSKLGPTQYSGLKKSFAEDDVDVFTFISTNNTSTTIGPMTYTGTGDVVSTSVSATDGTQVVVGDTPVFSSWATNENHVVSVVVDEPDKLTELSGFNAKGLVSIDLSTLTNLTGHLDMADNSLATFIDAPLSNTIDEINIQNNLLLSFNWDNYQQSDMLFTKGNDNMGSFGLTGVAVDLQNFSYSGTGNVDLSSFTGVKTNTIIEIDRNGLSEAIGSFTQPSIGAGSFGNCTFYNLALTTLDVSNFTDWTGRLFVRDCGVLTTITNPTSTNGLVEIVVRSNPLLTTCDISGFNAYKTQVQIRSCVLMTTTTMATTTITVKTNIDMGSCDFGYIDYTVLTGFMQYNNITVSLGSNTKTTTEVNHELVDFAAMVAGEGAGGDHTGGVVTTAGDNAAPDGTSGGFDGDQAVIDLVDKGRTVFTN